MTLVVGEVSGHRTAVVSDTQVMKSDARLPIGAGIIKTYMLPGGICVSFANSPDLAINDIQEFAKAHPQGVTYEATVSFFELASKKSENEYLIAFAKFSKLVKVTDGKRVPSIAKTQWIGDVSAYNRFREYRTMAQKKYEAGRAINAVLFADEIDQSPASDLYSAMRQVIADPKIPSVGGFAYVLSDRLDAYRQSAYCDMLFDWPMGETEDFILRLTDQIDFGASGENRNFSISQGSPSYLNMNVAVFYLLSAKKLFVFLGRQSDLLMRCTVLDLVEPPQIRARLNSFFGADLGWLIQVMSASPYATMSKQRDVPILTGPNGVRFDIFCHENTFPKTPAKD